MSTPGTHMPTFVEIARSLGHTDKCGSRHTVGHTYGASYDEWLAPYRNKDVLVLEVGVAVFGGGGLLALAEYFPKGHIVGVDNNMAPLVDAVRTHPRIELIDTDAYAADLPDKLGKRQFDIVIDDASHELRHQFALLQTLRPYLKQDGFYVIEDIVTEHWLPYLRNNTPKLGLHHTLVDMANRGFYDNNLIRFEPHP